VADLTNAAASEWIDAHEAADYLKVKYRTILKWAKAGNVPAHPVISGRKRITWRFLKSELDRAMLTPPSAAGTGRTQ
jgi:excisionase family DNA binding protein